MYVVRMFVTAYIHVCGMHSSYNNYVYIHTLCYTHQKLLNKRFSGIPTSII